MWIMIGLGFGFNMLVAWCGGYRRGYKCFGWDLNDFFVILFVDVVSVVGVFDAV